MVMRLAVALDKQSISKPEGKSATTIRESEMKRIEIGNWNGVPSATGICPNQSLGSDSIVTAYEAVPWCK